MIIQFTKKTNKFEVNYDFSKVTTKDNLSLYKVKLNGKDTDKFLKAIMHKLFELEGLYNIDKKAYELVLPYLKRVLENIYFDDSSKDILLSLKDLNNYSTSELTNDKNIAELFEKITVMLKSFDLKTVEDMLLSEIDIDFDLKCKLEAQNIYSISSLQTFLKVRPYSYMIFKDDDKQKEYKERLERMSNTVSQEKAKLLDLNSEQIEKLQNIVDLYKDNKNKSIQASLI